MLDGTRDQMNLTNILGTFYLNTTDYRVHSSQQLRELIQNALFSRTQKSLNKLIEIKYFITVFCVQWNKIENQKQEKLQKVQKFMEI